MPRKTFYGRHKTEIVWISVKDELPDGPATVMVALRDPELPVWLGYWENDFWNDVDGSGYDASAVTHWADLPAKPFSKSPGREVQ